MCTCKRIVPAAILSLTCAAIASTAALGQAVFSDNFDAGPSPLWENQRGNWSATAGEYAAGAPTNNPPTCSALPFVLGDLEMEVDVIDVIDGGLWLHIDQAGDNGVLLVTGGDAQTGRGFYWHTIRNGGVTGTFGRTGPLFNQLDDLHLRVTVVGDTYALYLNGGMAPVTMLVNSEFPTGRVGLYDYAVGAQRFDNFVLRSPCIVDFNGDGFVNPDDLSDFITCFFLQVQLPPSCPQADFNADGFINPDDLSDYITAFFTTVC
jgi:hypothetical protein